MVPGLGGGPQPFGLVGGGDPGDQRPREVVAAPGVVGELGGRGEGAPGRGGVGDDPGEGGVQAHPLPRQQVLVDGLVQQGVVEGVAVLAVDVEDAGGDGGPDRPLDVVLAGPRGRAQQVVADAAAPDGGGADEVGDLGGQRLDPPDHHVGQRAGQPAVAAGTGEQELRGVVGVALGALVDPPQGRGVGVVPGQGAQEPPHLVHVEGVEDDAAHRREAGQLGQDRAQRVPAVQVVGADGGDDQQALPAQPAQQEGQQAEAGAVGPVQVLEDQQDLVLAGGGGQDPGDGVEELQLRQAGLPGPGAVPEPPVLRGAAAQRFEGLDEGQVGQGPAPGGGAVADEDGAAAGPGAVGELGDEPGLAHPGVGLDEHGAGGAGPGVVEGALEGVELGGAPDELGRAGAPGGGRQDGHARHRGTGRGGARRCGAHARRRHHRRRGASRRRRAARSSRTRCSRAARARASSRRRARPWCSSQSSAVRSMPTTLALRGWRWRPAFTSSRRAPSALVTYSP